MKTQEMKTQTHHHNQFHSGVDWRNVYNWAQSPKSVTQALTPNCSVCVCVCVCVNTSPVELVGENIMPLDRHHGSTPSLIRQRNLLYSAQYFMIESLWGGRTSLVMVGQVEGGFTDNLCV